MVSSRWTRLPLAASALCLGVAGHAAVGPACKPPPPQQLVERFMSADCEACWQAAGTRDGRASTMVLDWIAPTAPRAPLAAGSVMEAAARAPALTATATLQRQASLSRVDAPRLRIADGPAWNGYVGVQLTVDRRAALPAGAQAYVALVERVPAGSEGSGVTRQLVRAVAGPLSLEEQSTVRTVRHFRAMRLPEGTRIEQLGSVGWVETAQGMVIAATQSAAANCKAVR